MLRDTPLQPHNDSESSPHLVVLTGAGMSVESGLPTYRGSGGLWRNHSFERLASIAGWRENPELVLEFYNDRRAQLATVKPNAGHLGLVCLESKFRVSVITQNVDDLHERAGSSNILHLHGLLTQARSTLDETYVKDIGYQTLRMGDCCPRGGQLRPNVVWFGELVPNMDHAAEIVESADYLVVIGTSLNVYPAALLLNYAPSHCRIFAIDPEPPSIASGLNAHIIQAGASDGVGTLARLLLEEQASGRGAY